MGGEVRIALQKDNVCKLEERNPVLMAQVFNLGHYSHDSFAKPLLEWDSFFFVFFFLIKKIFFISWRLITLQYCSGFCHTLT